MEEYARQELWSPSDRLVALGSFDDCVILDANTLTLVADSG
jgi:hypothetical protein